MNKQNKRAFTLIELLVVVLIIGILAAIALPQYQKAVVKSRFAEAFVHIKTLSEALEVCRLEMGDEDCAPSSLALSIGTESNIPNVDRLTDNFGYTINFSGNIEASYRKDNVCICYAPQNNRYVLAAKSNNICFEEWSGKDPKFEYDKLLGLDIDTTGNCFCC